MAVEDRANYDFKNWAKYAAVVETEETCVKRLGSERDQSRELEKLYYKNQVFRQNQGSSEDQTRNN